MEYFDKFIQYLFSPTGAAPLLFGILLAGPAGFGLALWYFRKRNEDLSQDVTRFKEMLEDERKQKSEWREKCSQKESENQSLKSKIGSGPLCGICKGKLSVGRRYKNNQYMGSPEYIDLHCDECGLTWPMNFHDIKSKI